MLTEVPFLNAKVVSPYEYRQISDIKVGFMPRSLDTAYVNELYEILSDGGKFYDNIAIFEDGELIDGLHRLEAYKRTSILTVLVQVWKCPKENRTALKIHLNSAHGKQLSRREKQESYSNLIQENPEITDEQAAKVFAVTERTIQRWKPEAMKQKRLSQEEVQKIQELKEQGKTQREIAEEIGVNQNTVQHHLNKNDNCHICSEPDSPSNIIPSPVSFQKQESVNDYDDDEEDLEEIDDNTIYQVVKKDPEKELKALGLKLQDSLDFLMHWGKHIQPVLDNPIALNGVSPDVIGEMVLLANQNLNRLKEFFPTITKAERR